MFASLLTLIRFTRDPAPTVLSSDEFERLYCPPRSAIYCLA